MIYTVYKRESRMKTNGFGWCLYNHLTIHLHTRFKLVAVVVAFLKRSKWCDGKLTTTRPFEKVTRKSFRIWWAGWSLNRAIKKML